MRSVWHLTSPLLNWKLAATSDRNPEKTDSMIPACCVGNQYRCGIKVPPRATRPPLKPCGFISSTVSTAIHLSCYTSSPRRPDVGATSFVTRTVLFIHGLESGPHGRKVRHLTRAGFTVVSKLMPCGRAQFVRDPFVVGAAVSVAAAVAASSKAAGFLGFMLTVSLIGAAAPWAVSRLTRRVLRRSVELQTGALATHGIDVVVGSSFGGAVALELLMRGAWSGPTLLLCPAHQLVARRAWHPVPPSLASLSAAVSSQVVVVHGRADQTVPVTHSEALVAGSHARLVLIDDDHRLSASSSSEQLADWVAMTAGPSIADSP